MRILNVSSCAPLRRPGEVVDAMRIFASAMGQIDNVGDTVLRRAFLDVLRPAGDLHVFIGARGDDYLSGLGLAESDRLFRSSGTWRKTISRAAFREAIGYAFNAGEMETQRAYAMHYARLAPLLMASRARGGRAIHAGLGIRTATPWRYPIAATLRLCDIVSWRDSYSRSMMGLGTVAPDWAFALGSPDGALTTEWSAQGRTRLAVSLRYNGALPDSTWVRTVRAFAKSRDLEVVTVSQIMRDGPLAQELARELGGEAVVWDGPDHATQEERLRSVYRTSRLVLTNRLHAAVIALTEGAIPLALASSSYDKTPRTLATAGIVGVTVDSRMAEAAGLEDTAAAALASTVPILQKVVEARGALRRLGQEIHRLTA